MEISVLVPVYNEADNVEPLVEEIINVMMNFEKHLTSKFSSRCCVTRLPRNLSDI